MTRRDILTAAAQIISQKGYHATSMSDIAAAVNLLPFPTALRIGYVAFAAAAARPAVPLTAEKDRLAGDRTRQTIADLPKTVCCRSW